MLVAEPVTGVERRWDLCGAHPESDEDGAATRVSEQVRDELHRAGIGPLHVVEQQHDRLVKGERGQQRPDGAIGAVALRLLQLGASVGTSGEKAGSTVASSV